jgi:hypothetical protein
MANASVQAFKAALRDISARAKARLPARVENEANGLAAAMKDAAGAHRRSGNTVESIQVAKTSKASRFRVTAGGDLTTKEVRKGSGKTFDYVRGEEFSTVTMPAIPFFFTTYRARKAEMKKRIADGIASDITS